MKFSAFDHECMALALRLGAKGLNSTHPNPRVGCVIARGQEVIACGWHVSAGGPHAEVHALESAGSAARGATAFVNLEPCSHHGRTPPCTDALIAAGIKRVVVALQDPNARVNGDGLRRLEAAGITVDIGLMAQEAEELNAGFLMRMRANRPWMRVKIATSLDGRTALPNGKSHWITSPESRQDVQSWRARSSAILTGVGTVLADDPAMTVRIKDAPRHPLRVVADTRWRTPPQSRILREGSTALIAGGDGLAVPATLGDSGARCLTLPLKAGRVDLAALMSALAGEGVNEVQVEAGATLCGALLKAGLVDEILLYQAPVLLGDGGPGPFALGTLESVQEGTHLEVLESCYWGGMCGCVCGRGRSPIDWPPTPLQAVDVFTGIVLSTGRVRARTAHGSDVRLSIQTEGFDFGSARRGDSISVSGVCLTMLDPVGSGFEADVSVETLGLTTLGGVQPGDRVNLEPALSLSDRLGGHLVTGHVDGMAKLVARVPDGRAERFEFELPKMLARYVARKGSVCVDGVSLTVNDVDDKGFSVCLIPHTLAVTTLGDLTVGDRVNVEVDLIARYLERLQGQA